ncbi:50S ribosomal protein L22 [miscellaneous Crenarchaeota group archaeon SMTZ-80]|nr:MAG: 50S ribosomal protein L22 [miscellaneous Crenarchaeota group archaeon SMTZ-80]
MPTWDYAVKDLDANKTAKCAGREYRISSKAATEICREIKGMSLTKARKLLEDVIAKKRAIAYKSYKKDIPHRRQLSKFYAGKYPIKAARRILQLLDELEANAEYKGLNTEKLKITHAAAHRGRKIKKFIPRAFGRASPYFDTLTHIELVSYESE